MKWPVDVRIVSQSDFVMFIPRLKIQGKIHHMQFIYWMHPTVRTINNASFMMMCYAQFIQNVLSRRWIVRVREEESVRMRKNRAEEKSFLHLRFCLLFYPIFPAMVYMCVGLLQTQEYYYSKGSRFLYFYFIPGILLLFSAVNFSFWYTRAQCHITNKRRWGRRLCLVSLFVYCHRRTRVEFCSQYKRAHIALDA